MLAMHGTTADNLENILKNGLLCDREKIWSVSTDAVFCWSKNYITANDFEEEEIYDALKEQALSSATVGLAKAKDCRAVIIVFNIDDSELEDDDSCPHMDDANCINRNINPSEFVEVLVSEDLSLARGAFIAGLLHRELINFEFSSIEYKIGRLFWESNISWYEIIEDLELTNIL